MDRWRENKGQYYENPELLRARQKKRHDPRDQVQGVLHQSWLALFRDLTDTRKSRPNHFVRLRNWQADVARRLDAMWPVHRPQGEKRQGNIRGDVVHTVAIRNGLSVNGVVEWHEKTADFVVVSDD
jgi:hypothetical protein